MQQGRVQLDADWNEQMDIIDNRIRVGSMDFIGGSGAPSGDPGYKITPTKTDLTIGKGRFYVQGILIENEKDFSYSSQTLPAQYVLSSQKTDGLYLAYLDVWQQGINAAIDPSIEEPALNGADTTMRIKNVAQVKLLPLPNSQYTGTALKCSTVIDKDTKNKAAWQTAIATSTGKLSAKVSANANLKNQLYRVEIHKSGDQNTATFKWSRDNGALVGKIKSINGTTVTLANRNNQTLNFKAGQWVELSTTKRTLKNQSGKFVKLLRIAGNELTLTQSLTDTEKNEFLSKDVITTVRQWNIDEKLTQAKNFFPIKSIRENNTVKITLTANNKPTNLAKNVLVELKKDKNAARGSFSQIKSINGNTVTVNDFAKTDAEIKELTLIRVVTSAINSVNSDSSISIENGLSIIFTAGTYKTGDYWLIPTRAETNNIASAQYDFKISQSPEGIVHYHAQLALLRKTGTTWELTGDCRKLISALSNEAYKSEPGDNESSVFVDKIGNVTVKKQLKVDGNITLNGITDIKKLKNLAQLPEKNKAPMADSLGYIDKKWLLADSDINNLMRLSNGQWISDLKPMPTPRYSFAMGVVHGKVYTVGGYNTGGISAIEKYDPQTNTWTEKKSRFIYAHIATAVINDKIYVFGGFRSSSTAYNTVEMYDPTTDMWTTKASMPTARRDATASVLNGKIYVFGGFSNTSLNTVEEYDPLNNTWRSSDPTKNATGVESLASMQIARHAVTASSVNGKIYLFGGFDSGQGKIVDKIEEYDPLANNGKGKSIYKKSVLLKESAASCVVNGIIYIIGGFNGNKKSNTIEAYNSITDEITFKKSMSISRFLLSVGVVNGKIYAMGGKFSSNSKVSNTVEEYHPILNQWTPNRIAPMSTSRAYQTAAVVNSKLYVIGGKNSALLNSVEEYDPFSNQWTTKKSIPVTSIRATSVGVINGKIYTFGGYIGNTFSKAVWEYDPIKNDWLQKKDLESVKGWGASSVVDGKIYIFDGVGNRDIEVYDPIANNSQGQGKLIGKVSKQLLGVTSSVVNGKIYLIGGADNRNAKVGVTRVDEYDPASYKDDGNWQPTAKAPMPTARGLLTSTVINGKIYVFGGTTKDGTGGKDIDIVEVYDPVANTWNTAASMPTARSGISSGVIAGKAYIVGGFSNIVEIYLPAAIENKKIEINTQKEFETIFGNGSAGVTIPENKTIILNPIQGVVQGDLSSGAWGGKGDTSGNTYNGQPAYVLKNTVNLSSNVSIIGFNEETTIIIKEKADNKFHVSGTTAKPVTGIQLKGWSFDGRGGVLIDPTSTTNTTTLGGKLIGTTASGAFSLSYCRNIELNCKIINCKVKNNAGAIGGSNEKTNHIIAERIYNCSATGGNGGGVSNCWNSTFKIYSCSSSGSGGGANACAYSTIYAEKCTAAVNGGGVYNSFYSNITVHLCKAGANGGGADYCGNSTINATGCNAKTKGGGVHNCNKIIVTGHWSSNSAKSADNISESSWIGTFAINHNTAQHQTTFKATDV